MADTPGVSVISKLGGIAEGMFSAELRATAKANWGALANEATRTQAQTMLGSQIGSMALRGAMYGAGGAALYTAGDNVSNNRSVMSGMMG